MVAACPVKSGHAFRPRQIERPGFAVADDDAPQVRASGEQPGLCVGEAVFHLAQDHAPGFAHMRPWATSRPRW